MLGSSSLGPAGLAAFNRLAGRRPPAPLEVAELREEAVRATGGLCDFDGEAFAEPLERLVRSLEEEAALTPAGRAIARVRLRDHLANRLRLVADEARWPGIRSERIERPLVIAGLPRTGTTILFHMLAQDPELLSPLSWKLQYPSPPPGRGVGRFDRRVVAQKARGHFLYSVLPALRHVYRTAALLPEECVVMKAHEFTAILFSIAYRVPRYASWLLDCDHTAAYAMHERFLQHLQFGVERPRWVLKSPEHLLCLEPLLARYPDACIVQTHRDPLTVLPSFASLTAILRSLSSDAIDAREIGVETAHFWSTALERARRQRAAHPEWESQIVDVQYDDICADPMAVVERIYARAGRELGAPARAAMLRFLKRHPKNRHGEHVYSLERFELDREREAERFAGYRAAVGYR
ncbi:MAG: sulfotransferase [Proteobacteria bacterium]|nr:sulfotransferase [Pseudomonadota bacterium]